MAGAREKCAYTRELIDVSSFHIDHIVPENLADDPQKFEETKAKLNMGAAFDAAAFVATCKRFQVPSAVERSRSGNDAHVWIFFDRPVSAADARRLGCSLLTRTMENRHEIGLDSYDRLFPNQDTIPKGGFGNLIALPLQKRPRELGNSVFLG